MRRWVAAAALVAVVAAGVLALALTASADKRHLAFTTDVAPTALAAVIHAGQSACEREVHVEEPFDTVQAYVWTGPPSPRLAVTVARSRGGPTLATGAVRAGRVRRLIVFSPSVPLSSRIRAGGFVDVCFRLAGRTPAAFLGHIDTHADPSHAVLVTARGRDRELGSDLRLVFGRRKGRSVLSQLPAVFRRAALFWPSPVGAWTFWVMLAAVLLGVPALLARALRSAASEPPADPSVP
jgi:hypothetical protein